MYDTKIPLDQLNIKVEAIPEERSIGEGCQDTNQEFIDSVRENQKKSEEWGWCIVRVSVSFKDGPEELCGTTYLSQCSYISENDFIQNSGYFEQMVDMAVDDLLTELRNKLWEYDRLREKLANQLINIAVKFPTPRPHTCYLHRHG